MTQSLACQVLGACIRDAIEFVVENGQLRVSGPPEVLTPEVIALIRPHKASMVAMLSGNSVDSHVPGIVWDPRGGVRVADPWLHHLSDIDPADPEGSRELMFEQECQRQDEQAAVEEVAFFQDAHEQWLAERQLSHGNQSNE